MINFKNPSGFFLLLKAVFLVVKKNLIGHNDRTAIPKAENF
jgi:hypothetical protein